MCKHLDVRKRASDKIFPYREQSPEKAHSARLIYNNVYADICEANHCTGEKAASRRQRKRPQVPDMRRSRISASGAPLLHEIIPMPARIHAASRQDRHVDLWNTFLNLTFKMIDLQWFL